MIESRLVTNGEIADSLAALRQKNPLVHCITNEVVQEITANVLLACGASPAMVVGEGETAGFAKIASALLINVGTPYLNRVEIMKEAAKAAAEAGTVWVLDPVAAGGMPWRDEIIFSLLELKPTVVRGNASEIKALAGQGKGGKGVDSLDSSDSALDAAVSLARRWKTIVVVTGKTDYVTDGNEILKATGGNEMITKVVGTGCSLSAMVGAFVSTASDPLVGAAACCAYVKKASENAFALSSGPGSFHVAYLDALYNLKGSDFA